MCASSSANKNTKSVDRLSALPDDILCYILSFLETKEAAITCLLSKRWQFLWTKLPGLRFSDHCITVEEKRKFVSRVNRTLVICRRDNLESFEICFYGDYDECFAPDINLWVRFAVENKVKIFTLMLPCDHVLPQMMYSNPSWTSLTLEGCIMNLRGTIQWQSLTTLWIEEVELNNYTFEKIFSGCPVLSTLYVVFCWGFDLLEVNSPSLSTLAIVGDEDSGYLKIAAPHIQTIKIDFLSIYRNFSLENIKSLVRADIDFNDGWPLDDIITARRSVEQFFGSIRHVMMLEMGRGGCELLSLIARDWQLPQSTRRCLELHAYYGDICILGILGLLKSSPKLETLDIEIAASSYEDNDPLNPGSTDDLDCDLLHLKTVCFGLSSRLELSPRVDINTSEPLMTLARILLKRAIVLEKMVVRIPGFTASSSTSEFYEMTQTLLSYPRSSPKAVVELERGEIPMLI